jgi:dCMP deaminase
MQWDEYFLRISELVAQKSKDRSKKVGAVIVGEGNEIRSTGFNGFPRGIDDDVDARHERPAKYMWTEHAERNAIFNAARNGTHTAGTTMYLNAWYPCADCARAVIQAGITRIVVSRSRHHRPNSRWNESCAVGMEMLREAGVQCDVSDVEL